MFNACLFEQSRNPNSYLIIITRSIDVSGQKNVFFWH